MDTNIAEIIGLPPDHFINQKLIRNTMPVLKIRPSEPNFDEGLTLFSLKDAWEKYNYLLKAHGYSAGSGPLKVAFQCDQMPSDTFTNEYGESFLNKLTDVVSSGSAEIAQMTGSRTASQGLGKITDALSKMGTTGEAMSKLINSGKDKISEVVKGFNGGDKIAGLMDSLATGARIDFPHVWKNSAFNPSYTFNIKLYNPNPSSKDATKKYIVGPLGALLLLGIPITEDGDTYNWPFLHRIECPGLFSIKAGCITNISVTKGGENHNVAYNQRLGMVDVRIEVASLFTSMMAGSNSYKAKDRPTLLNYLQVLEDSRPIEKLPTDPNDGSGSSVVPGTRGLTSSLSNGLTDITGNTFDRVSSLAKTTSQDLSSKMPSI